MNELLVPFWAPPMVRVAVIVKLPVFEIVTACDARTPFVNAAVAPEPAESVPVDVMFTVFPAPVKPVTVLLLASRAVMRMLKPVPAVWVPIAPPPAASTRKLAERAGVDRERIARAVLGAAASCGWP